MKRRRRRWNCSGRLSHEDALAPVLARGKAQSAQAVCVACGTASSEEETVNPEQESNWENYLNWLTWQKTAKADDEPLARRADMFLAVDADLKESLRRIAELEQANRDLERLRVVASRERDEAREHRRILKEAVALMLRVRAAVSKPDPSVDAMVLGDVWRQVEHALAVTSEP